MKLSKKIIIFIIFIIVVIVSVILLPKRETVDTSIEIKDIRENIEITEWHASWIWDNKSIEETTWINNTWMNFRKTFVINEDFKDVIAKIAADSKYWLYINDELVVFEGGLKRGQTPNSTYYDRLDITDYLKKGENTISILVWCLGPKSNKSYLSSGSPGLLFQANIYENIIISDETWKVQKNEAYINNTEEDKIDGIANDRLAEYSIYYDSRIGDENWYLSGYNSENWDNAKILDTANSEIFGDLVERPIPLWKDSGLKDYINTNEYANYTVNEDTTIDMRLEYNKQVTPYLEIEAPAGLKITIHSDTYYDSSGNSLKSNYITKEGRQKFESFSWINGEHIYYKIPAGVKIIILKYRETGYDTEITGSFNSSDEFYNKLWEKSARTLYVNMRDTYMDCPNRERAQWWGDVTTDMQESLYALDSKSYKLYEKGVNTIIGWSNNNVLPTVAPNFNCTDNLPLQMLAGINGFYNYYLYTGDKIILEKFYPYEKNYLNLWKIKDNGLVKYTGKEAVWMWADFKDNIDITAIENAWYGAALNSMIKSARELGYEEDALHYEEMYNDLKNSFQTFWTSNGYKSSLVNIPDERTNAVAVLAGFVPEERKETVKNVLVYTKNCTPYMEYYVIDALCRMGYIDEAGVRIKSRFSKMVEGPKAYSTLWEFWIREEGTVNHAWTGGQLVNLSKYFAGIYPNTAGYNTYTIKPHLNDLNEISTKVPTVKGEISLDIQKTDKKETIRLVSPKDTTAYLYIDKQNDNPTIEINERVVYKDKEAVSNLKIILENEKQLCIELSSGIYEITSL